MTSSLAARHGRLYHCQAWQYSTCPGPAAASGSRP